MNELGSALLNELPANGLLALLLVPVIQWAKKSGRPWLAWVTSRSAPYVSAALAFVGALGIHWQFDPAAGRLVIEGLTFGSILQGAIEWGKQYAANHWTHKGYKVIDALGRVFDTPDDPPLVR